MIGTTTATSSALQGVAGTSPPLITASPPPFARTLQTFINPQPISKTSIIRNNPRIVDPYRGKKESDPTFTAVAAKVGGTALGTLYEMIPTTPIASKPPKRYLGKVGIGRGVFVEDRSTYRTLTKKEMNYEVILEKLAYDLYQELGRGIFQVPKSYLSRQPILDPYTQDNRLALFLVGTAVDIARQGLPLTEATPASQTLTNESLRIMCSLLEGYQDLQHGRAKSPEGSPLSVSTYIERYCHPPEQLLTPDGREVPIRGLIGLLAVARILADTDAIGGEGGNAGYIWIKDETNQIIAAQAIKIDPGMAFHFGEENEANWAANTYYRRRRGRTLEDVKDLQIAQNYHPLTIHWSSLTPAQKTEFLQVLYNSSRYLNTPDILTYLFYRDGQFNRTETEQNPPATAIKFRDQMTRWLNIQLEIYQEELTQFKQQYQTQIICTQQIDQWGEFLLDQQQQAVETAMRRLSRRLEQTRQELEVSRLAQETMQRELERMREESDRKREESDRKIEMLLRRLETLEARPATYPTPTSTYQPPTPPPSSPVSLFSEPTGRASPTPFSALFSVPPSSLAMPSLSSSLISTPVKPAIAFGAADWSRYFGEVGVEPPLPANIEEILSSRCPFWPDKTIRETHLLTLIPATVEGHPYTLNSLEALIKAPRNGGHATAYARYGDELKSYEGSKAPARSSWVLLTRDVLSGTRRKSYAEQKRVLGEQASRTGLLRGGVDPTLLQAATAILMEYVRTGRRLYGDAPGTYTRCQEVSIGYQTVVGGFAAAGLRIDGIYFHVSEICGLACSWKF